MEVRGLEQLQAKLKKLAPAAARALETALIQDVAGAVMKEAQRTVPVVTGRLRSSAFVRKVARNQYRTDLRFGYDAPYAVYVHEIPYTGRTTRGKIGAKNNGKGYKWLQRAYYRVRASAVNRAWNRVRSEVRKVWGR